MIRKRFHYGAAAERTVEASTGYRSRTSSAESARSDCLQPVAAGRDAKP
jgi:hypothetical protein